MENFHLSYFSTLLLFPDLLEYILFTVFLWFSQVSEPRCLTKHPQDLLPLVTAGHCSAWAFSANASSKILQHFQEISKIIDAFAITVGLSWPM